MRLRERRLEESYPLADLRGLIPPIARLGTSCLPTNRPVSGFCPVILW
jgi:hypothetical protein